VSDTKTELDLTLEPPGPPAEQRGARRHQIKQRCVVALADSGAGGYTCLTFNISTDGIGLFLPLPLRAGAEVHIEPLALPGAPALRARVVHRQRLEFAWICGCEFLTPLTDAQLAAWLG